jgi:hypothetical protein
MVHLTWIRPISANDRSESVLRLTNAKGVLPPDVFVSGEVDEIDPYSPPPGLASIEISWGNGKHSRHFIRSDNNKYMITHRTTHVRDFYSSVPGTARNVAITHMGSHKFLITAVES